MSLSTVLLWRTGIEPVAVLFCARMLMGVVGDKLARAHQVRFIFSNCSGKLDTRTHTHTAPPASHYYIQPGTIVDGHINTPPFHTDGSGVIRK